MMEIVQQKANKRRANPNKRSVNSQEGKTEEVLRCIFLKALKIIIRNPLFWAKVFSFWNSAQHYANIYYISENSGAYHIPHISACPRKSVSNFLHLFCMYISHLARIKSIIVVATPNKPLWKVWKQEKMLNTWKILSVSSLFCYFFLYSITCWWH